MAPRIRGRGGTRIGDREGGVGSRAEGGTHSGKNHDRCSLEEGAVQAGGEEDSRKGKTTERVRVEGARRVWGTMKETTSTSLKYAVSSLQHYCPTN